MAGDWIKWTKGLAARREVAILAAMTNRDRHEIAGRLMVLWEWCDDNTTEDDADESLNVSLNIGDKPYEFLDALLGLPGLAEAMSSPGVRWLDARSGGRVVFPKLARHNGTSAKTRAYEASKKSRQRKAGKVVPKVSPKCPDDKGTKPGPEKRREEKKEEKTSAAVPQAATPHAEAKAEFAERWQRKYGKVYPFNGRDGKAVKEILPLVDSDIERLKPILDRFFLDDDPFFAADSRHAWPKLQQNFARWLVEGTPNAKRNGTGPGDGRPSVDPPPANVNGQYTRERLDAVARSRAEQSGKPEIVGPADGSGSQESQAGQAGATRPDTPF